MSNEEKKTGPALRFRDEGGKEFAEWTEEQFKELMFFLTTNSLSRSQLNYEDGTVRNIHYGDIHTKLRTLLDVTQADLPFINDDVRIDKVNEENFCREGDLVIADASEDYNDVGKSIEIVSLNGERVLAGLHTFLVRDKVPLAKGFKGYLMQSRKVRLQVMKMATGISVLSLSKGNLSKLKLTVPVYEEQQKIASFLTAIDDKIENLEQQLEELKAFKKGVMQGLFSEDGEHMMGGGNLIFSFRFRDKNGSDFPAWRKTTLGAIGHFQKGKGIAKSDIDEEGQMPCIRYGELYTIYNERILEVVSRTNQKQEDLVMSEANDVIIPASGETSIDIAKASCIMLKGVALGGDLNIFRSPENGVFLSYYLNNRKRRDIAALAQGNSVVHLYAQQLKTLEIALPARDEQNRIADYLVALDSRLEVVMKTIAETSRYKKSLLQQLFN